MPKRKRLFLLVLVVVGLFVVVRNTQLSPLRKRSESAVALFHQRYNQGQYELIYQEATENFKRRYEKAELISLLRVANEHLGSAAKADIYKWGYEDNFVGRIVYLISTTKFRHPGENSQTVKESFHFLIDEDAIRLDQYKTDQSDHR